MKNRTMLLAALVSVALLSWAGCGGGAGAEEGAADAAYADRMATEHAGDTPVASPATGEAAGAGAVSDSEVVYAELDGTSVSGYLARPEGVDAGAPAMIVIHEWWGLNDNVRAMARKLAGEGYVALAVDLYAGEVAEDSEGARAIMQKAMQNPERLKENLRQAHAYLVGEQGAGKVGSIGWCFGGGWSLQTALLLGDDLDAAVIYYGRVVTDPTELEALSAPVIGHFGSEDRGIPVEGVREFEDTLAKLGKTAEIYVYEGANHAFANPSGTRYDAAAAEEAWTRTLDFLSRHLGG